MYRDLDERALAEACCAKDRLAEDELYTRYAARVYTLCRRYLGDADDAKDLMQEALIQAFDKIPTFRYSGKGSLYGWIRRIAINKALDQVRRKRWKTISLDFGKHADIPDPTDEEMEKIPQEKLLEWIARLPDMRRTIFNLYCIDEYSHKEIAEALGITEKGSASALTKARKQLKEEIRLYLKER